MRHPLALLSLSAVLALSAWQTACRTARSSASSAEAPSRTVTSESMSSGEILFRQHCNRCHLLPRPERYTTAQWQPIMQRMQPKARISDAEREQILQYLTQKT